MMPSQTGSTPGIFSSARRDDRHDDEDDLEGVHHEAEQEHRQHHRQHGAGDAARQIGERALHHGVAAERAEHQAEQRGADQDEKDHAR